MRFGPTLANDRVDLDLFPGEIHGLVGQNGVFNSGAGSITSSFATGSVSSAGINVTLGGVGFVAWR